MSEVLENLRTIIGKCTELNSAYTLKADEFNQLIKLINTVQDIFNDFEKNVDTKVSELKIKLEQVTSTNLELQQKINTISSEKNSVMSQLDKRSSNSKQQNSNIKTILSSFTPPSDLSDKIKEQKEQLVAANKLIENLKTSSSKARSDVNAAIIANTPSPTVPSGLPFRSNGLGLGFNKPQRTYSNAVIGANRGGSKKKSKKSMKN